MKSSGMWVVTLGMFAGFFGTSAIFMAIFWS